MKRVIINSAVIAGAFLLLPGVGMLLNLGIRWGLLDFVLAFLLVFVTCFGVQTLLRLVKNKTQRYISIVLLVLLMMLIWADLAVGIFNLPWSGS